MNFRTLKENYVARVDAIIAQIDKYFETKKSSEVLMVTLAIPIVILFLFYQYVFPAKEKELASAKQEMVRVTNELALYKQVGVEEVNILSTQVTELEMQIEKQEELKSYIETQLLTLDNIYFTPKGWAETIEKMTSEAKKQGILIEQNRNEIKRDGSGFIPVVKFELVGSGQFDPLMNFFHTLEAGTKMIVVDELNITHSKNKELNFEAKLRLWEIR